MATGTRPLRVALIVAGSLALCAGACTNQNEQGASSTSTGNTAAANAGDVDDFCAAIEEMQFHDGTTEESIAMETIDEARRTVPAEMREDFLLVTDTLIVNNYPDSADPTMTAAPTEQGMEAGRRIGEYVDTHCDLGE